MGKNINFAICEDHSLEREIIQIYIENYFEKKDVKVNVTEYKSGNELLASDFSDLDIAFLDIYMDDIDGIETARRMSETNKNVKFVFCSASPRVHRPGRGPQRFPLFHQTAFPRKVQ